MDDNDIAQSLFDANVRIEEMFWIPGICAGAPRAFKDFLQDELADDCAPAILEALPFLKGFSDGVPDAEEVLAEMAMRRKNGFIFQAATPRPYEYRPDGSYSFSWGSYYTKWMYADSLEQAANMAIGWAAAVLDEAKAKAAA
jgi:hypothetical protein